MMKLPLKLKNISFIFIVEMQTAFCFFNLPSRKIPELVVGKMVVTPEISIVADNNLFW